MESSFLGISIYFYYLKEFGFTYWSLPLYFNSNSYHVLSYHVQAPTTVVHTAFTKIHIFNSLPPQARTSTVNVPTLTDHSQSVVDAHLVPFLHNPRSWSLDVALPKAQNTNNLFNNKKMKATLPFVFFN